ncbi:hypothetical protein [Rufibacter psychrotolerans]|uniref:hypothetical protein n=1 Tax=Rufibacter psychrotolerans TaxID=2812556 RepID=UPI001967AA6E|nr:hypothetical protein [Rufibacter sp. SYSU D00308]
MKDKSAGRTFRKQPHTITRQLGATPIGFDICDACNAYFGTIGRKDLYTFSPEVALIETFTNLRFLAQPQFGAAPELRSRFFHFHPATATIHPTGRFEPKARFLKNFTRQFKRGIYEVFLQEYHRNTQNGQADCFAKVREFARWDKGNLPLYFLQNREAFYMEEAPGCPSLTFDASALKEINEAGFYQMRLLGQLFFLEVTDSARLTRAAYLRKQLKEGAGKSSSFGELVRMELITDLDFTVRSLGIRTEILEPVL